MKRRKTCVLGAGLSGISHALQSETLGQEVTVFEKKSEVGGVLQSIKTKGYLLDYGANTLSLRLKSTEEFLRIHGVFDHLVDANEKCSKRFIVRKNQVVALPQSPLSFLTSSFLSSLGKMRLFMEPLISRRKDSSNDESLGDFVKRRLGNEVLEYAANPFIGGIYASRPESLILKHAFPLLYEMEKKYGSIFFGMIRRRGNQKEKLSQTRLVSFRGGMQELTTRLATRLKNPVESGIEIKKVECKDDGQWHILGENAKGEKVENNFEEVICTLPSHTLTKIDWKGIKEAQLVEEIANAKCPPLAVTFLGFKREQIIHPLDGFGFLVPEVEKKKILGTLFSSTLFPNRAPQNHVLLTSFIGGERNPELSKLPKNELLALAFAENQELLKIRGAPVFEHHKVWLNSIPLPDKTIASRIKASKNLSRKNKGLYILGAHINGAPLPNCMGPQSLSLFD